MLRALRQAQGPLTLEKTKVVEPVETPSYILVLLNLFINWIYFVCYFRSMKGTELPSMYCGILPSHFCTAS